MWTPAALIAALPGPSAATNHPLMRNSTLLFQKTVTAALHTHHYIPQGLVPRLIAHLVLEDAEAHALEQLKISSASGTAIISSGMDCRVMVMQPHGQGQPESVEALEMPSGVLPALKVNQRNSSGQIHCFRQYRMNRILLILREKGLAAGDSIDMYLGPGPKQLTFLWVRRMTDTCNAAAPSAAPITPAAASLADRHSPDMPISSAQPSGHLGKLMHKCCSISYRCPPGQYLFIWLIVRGS
jgi:hypothetical protein